VIAIPLYSRGCERWLELKAIAAWIAAHGVTACRFSYPPRPWIELRRRAPGSRAPAVPRQLEDRAIREAFIAAATELGITTAEFMQRVPADQKGRLAAAAKAELREGVAETPG
jgi:hypothetical protein